MAVDENRFGLLDVCELLLEGLLVVTEHHCDVVEPQRLGDFAELGRIHANARTLDTVVSGLRVSLETLPHVPEVFEAPIRLDELQLHTRSERRFRLDQGSLA